MIFHKVSYEKFKEAKFYIKKDIIVPKQSYAGNPYIEEVKKYYGENSRTKLLLDYLKLDECIYFERDILPLYPKALLNKGWDKDSVEVKLFS